MKENNSEKKEDLKLTMPDIVENDPDAKAEWERIVPELIKDGSLLELDRTILSGYCLNYSKIKRLEKYLSENKMTFRIGKKGYTQVRPEVSILRECWKLMKTFSDQLGLSPNSRKKLGVIGSDDDDKFFD